MGAGSNYDVVMRSQRLSYYARPLLLPSYAPSRPAERLMHIRDETDVQGRPWNDFRRKVVCCAQHSGAAICSSFEVAQQAVPVPIQKAQSRCARHVLPAPLCCLRPFAEDTSRCPCPCCCTSCDSGSPSSKCT